MRQLLKLWFYPLGLGLLGSMCGFQSVNAEDAWTRFRGPDGSGVSTETVSTPTKWSDTENLKWKTALPGPGSSSPIVVGEKLFVTCWSGYGVDRDGGGDQANLKRHLICIEKSSGKILWDKSVPAVLPEDEYGGMFAEHGYASHTPVSDGKKVYVFFGKSGAMAFDLDGNQLWQAKLGDGLDPRRWGSSSSPILYNNILIVTASAESKAIVGLDTENGKELWRAEAEGLNSTWGTPILVPVDDKKTDLVIGVPYEFWGLDPTTGKLRWFCEVMETDSFCSSVIAHDGIVYGIEGRGGGSIAVRAGGKDDVTKTNIVWQGRNSSRISTPIYYDGRIYFFSGRVANCIDAATGKEIYQTRLPAGNNNAGDNAVRGNEAGGQGGGRRGGGGGGGRGGQDYGSPVIADGKIYFVTRNGDMHVIKASEEFESISVNRVTSDREDFSGSPAISNGEIFVRSSKHLYCISDKK
ncbi:MAG: hypothetical protein RLY14_571 [Planctomycetota bacterium]|jgi:outer membrane protein assembly factor BamB